MTPDATAPGRKDVSASSRMMTFLFTVAEKPEGWDAAHPMMRGSMEMQRFAHPIHLGVVSAEDMTDAYAIVLENLRPTFADYPSPLEVRFEPIDPPSAARAGIWRRHRPIDMDITWTDAD